jgi:hypothetical protein
MDWERFASYQAQLIFLYHRGNQQR